MSHLRLPEVPHVKNMLVKPFTQTRNILFLAALIIMTALPGQNVTAQRKLSLSEALSIALEQSYAARSAKEQLRMSRASAEAARLSLLSSIDLNLNVPSYTSTLSPQFNPITGITEYFSIQRTQYEANLTISQPVLWTNSTISFSGLLYKRNQISGANDFSDYYTNFALRLKQPLFVPNTQKISLRRAELDYDQALLENGRTVLDIIFNVTNSFYKLYSARKRLEIQRERVKQQEESYRTALNQYKAGLIAEVDALQLQVDLAQARNDLFTSESDVRLQESGFNLLIGLPLNEQLHPVLEDTTFKRVSIDTKLAVEMGKKNRVELKRALYDIERSRMTLDEVEARRTIRGDLTATYGLSKTDPEFDLLFRDTRNISSVVFTLTVPILDWGRHAREVEGAEARLRQARYYAEQEDLTIEQEITELVRKVESAADRVEVLNKAKDVARRAYDITLARFRVGNVTSNELTQAQDRLTNAQLNALEALLEYRINLADLMRRTFYDFEKKQMVDLDEWLDALNFN